MSLFQLFHRIIPVIRLRQVICDFGLRLVVRPNPKPLLDPLASRSAVTRTRHIWKSQWPIPISSLCQSASPPCTKPATCSRFREAWERSVGGIRKKWSRGGFWWAPTRRLCPRVWADRAGISEPSPTPSARPITARKGTAHPLMREFEPERNRQANPPARAASRRGGHRRSLGNPTSFKQL